MGLAGVDDWGCGAEEEKEEEAWFRREVLERMFGWMTKEWVNGICRRRERISDIFSFFLALRME